MDRRNFLRLCLLTTSNLTIGSLPGIPKQVSAATARKQTVTIGIFSPSHCAAPIIFAEQKGYFKEFGLDVRLINFQTMSALAKNLLSGEIDFGQLTIPLIFSVHTGANQSRVKEKLVMPMVLGVHGSNLMISRDSGIIRPTDFRGKNIATHTKLTVHYLLVRLYLERSGVDAQTEVNMSIVKLKDLTKVLQEGKIDAFMMPEPLNALAEETNKASTYLLNQFIWRYHPCCGLAAKKMNFDTDNNKTQALIAAISKASLFINKESNRQELVALLTRTSYGFELLPRKVIDLAFAFSRSSFYPFPYQSTAILLLRLMQNYNLLPSTNIKDAASEVFLSDYMRGCLSKIGKRAPRTNYRPEIVLGRRFEVET